MTNVLQRLQQTFGEGRVRQNELMSLHTTFHIGGPAKYYLEVDLISDLVKAVSQAQEAGKPWYIIGGGSNTLFSDEGFDGIVIKNNCRRFDMYSMTGRITRQHLDIDKALVYAESGAIMNQLVRFTIENGLEGLEYQLGLPGSVGGAIFMNSHFPKKHAYAGDAVYQAQILTNDGKIATVERSYFRFAYDKSILQKTKEVVLSVIWKLKPSSKDMLWKRATEALTQRTSSQPKGSSAGCMFQNITLSEAMRIPTPSTITSAGYLIDKAGLKGKRIGNAVISDVHANFILNLGDAKAEDVMQLLTLMKDTVKARFGVTLSLEVQTVGF